MVQVSGCSDTRYEHTDTLLSNTWGSLLIGFTTRSNMYQMAGDGFRKIIV